MTLTYVNSDMSSVAQSFTLSENGENITKCGKNEISVYVNIKKQRVNTH